MVFLVVTEAPLGSGEGVIIDNLDTYRGDSHLFSIRGSPQHCKRKQVDCTSILFSDPLQCESKLCVILRYLVGGVYLSRRVHA